MFSKSFRQAVLFSQLLAVSISMSGCVCTDSKKHSAKNKNRNNEIADAGIITANRSKKATATIRAFKGNEIHGTVTFTQMADGVKIVADIEGLKPGKHGFHVHEFGECKGDGESAGGHFNPTKHKHGGPDSEERHVGDLGNLDADSNGRAHYERIDKMIQLEGENSVIGHSIIIHADEDDLITQPTGASGAKIACGLIEAEKN
ncbi:MAG: superoxide dismutase family protein [Candidatus Protochlamydia sp.]|nr:superoxide dismutase family protein [Candidatus Protochlamydia sp.]